jgi:hypothetical protein
MPESHLGQPAPEAGSRYDGLRALAEVLVDHEDAAARPSPGDRIAGQVVW